LQFSPEYWRRISSLGQPFAANAPNLTRNYTLQNLDENFRIFFNQRSFDFIVHAW